LTTAATAATAIGVVFAAIQLFLQRAHARTTFEDTLVRQYRELIKPQLVHDTDLAQIIAKHPGEDAARLQRIYLYLDLCNEQIFLRAIGRVSRSTWKVQWSRGIKDNIVGDTPIAHCWGLIKQNTNAFNELRAFEASDYSDPRSWEPRWRKPFVRLGLVTLRVPGTAAGD
jgi:hypothetical protein